MSDHTPGPWDLFIIASERGISYRVFAEKPGGGSIDIAHLPAEWSKVDNARLIKVAPDLLKIARWAVENDGGECLGDHPKRLAAARAAIAEAEGD